MCWPPRSITCGRAERRQRPATPPPPLPERLAIINSQALAAQERFEAARRKADGGAAGSPRPNRPRRRRSADDRVGRLMPTNSVGGLVRARSMVVCALGRPARAPASRDEFRWRRAAHEEERFDGDADRAQVRHADGADQMLRRCWRACRSSSSSPSRTRRSSPGSRARRSRRPASSTTWPASARSTAPSGACCSACSSSSRSWGWRSGRRWAR